MIAVPPSRSRVRLVARRTRVQLTSGAGRVAQSRLVGLLVATSRDGPMRGAGPAFALGRVREPLSDCVIAGVAAGGDALACSH
jgi:hypothetical protein